MRRLKGEDNSFLAWESDVQPQYTIKAVVLDPSQGREPVTLEAVRAAIPALVEHVEPLQWQLLMPRVGFGRPWWIARSEIDLDYHVKHVTAAAPGGDRELAAVIGDILEADTDRRRPPWQLWYVDGLAGGRVAFVLKVHHAIADGMASLRLLEAIYSTDPEAPLRQSRPGPPTDEQRPALRAWLPMVLRHQGAAALNFPRIITRSVRVASIMRRRQKAGKPGYAAAFSAPGTRFNAPLTTDRKFAYHTVDMATIKDVGKAFGVTVNDVFLAVCSGALRDFLDRHGELPVETLTAVVPVSMRPPGAETGWGNHVARWNVVLATDIADPVERLRAIADATTTAREVQAERDALLQHDWMEYWPLFWFYSRALPLVSERMTRRPTFSLIASNMRGPQRRLYWAGAPIEKLISTGPVVFPMGLNFTGWSYEDQMTICTLVCGDHVSDPWEIADGLPRALAELAALAPAVPESVEKAV
ncbi:wax ester/triacylglycerol synthase family O-acyltransferase [Mycobacterium sp. CSUR Q5927]|nr:wax ester/triacylglycerol synthase family O-acyltransferase [Mycobacterium sp. CSUR Q5927]